MPSTRRALTIALLRAREKVMGPIRMMLANADITEQQWRVLTVLDDLGTLEPTRISQETCLLLPSLTRILQKLEEKKLINRSQDPHDGRKQVIELSLKGKQLVDDNRSESTAIIDSVRDRMGHQKFENLVDLLNELEDI